MNKRRRTGITMNKKLGSTLIAMTIIIFMLFLTLGMFTKNFGGSASAEVASAQTSIQGDDKSLAGLDDNGNIDAESQGTYTFYVKNTNKDDGSKVSEVAMKYTLTIDTEQIDNSDVNVNYELYKVTTVNGNEVETKVNDWDATQGFTSDWPTLQQGTEQVDKYILKFTPDKEGQFKFQVKIKSQQVD